MVGQQDAGQIVGGVAGELIFVLFCGQYLCLFVADGLLSP